jgi:nucleoside-diphosphate-sugar epimerase
VTGASGFIGTQLSRRAAEQGAVVHALSRRDHPPADGLSWERADLTDATAVRDLVLAVRPDVVLHLAGEVSGSRDRERVLPMLHANLAAAVNVMTAASEAGCRRVVLAGSMEEPDIGDADAVPQSPYAAAKWGALAYARMFRALYALDVVHLRVFMVYGPGQTDVRKLVPYATVSFLREHPPKLTSGTRPIDWVYVDDVVDAFLAAAIAAGTEPASLDIGSGSLVTARSVVDRLREMVGAEVHAEFGAVPERALERIRVADPAPAERAIGWRPRVSLDEGLRRTVDFYRTQLDRLPAA